MAYSHWISNQMITAAQRERLYQFFAAYFHEDWPVEARSPDDVLSRFIRQTPTDELRQLSRNVMAFVEDHSSEDELDEALFKELGCYFSPRLAGVSVKQWLMDVASTLARPIGE